MDEDRIPLDSRPLSRIVKISYAFGILCILWALFFGVLLLVTDPSTHAFILFKSSMLTGFKGTIMMGGLGFILDKLDETKGYTATPLERKAISRSRKKKKNNAKNK